MGGSHPKTTRRPSRRDGLPYELFQLAQEGKRVQRLKARIAVINTLREQADRPLYKLSTDWRDLLTLEVPATLSRAESERYHALLDVMERNFKRTIEHRALEQHRQALVDDVNEHGLWGLLNEYQRGRICVPISPGAHQSVLDQQHTVHRAVDHLVARHLRL